MYDSNNKTKAVSGEIKQKLKEVESKASRLQTTSCNIKGAKARGKQIEVKRQQ